MLAEWLSDNWAELVVSAFMFAVVFAVVIVIAVMHFVRWLCHRE